jgi:hypothetical protein
LVGPEVCDKPPPGTAEVAGAEEVAGADEVAGAAVLGGAADVAGAAGRADEPGALVEACGVAELGAAVEDALWAPAGAATGAAVATQTSRTVIRRRRIPGRA